MGEAAPSAAGLREAGRQLVAGLVDIGHTRLSLAALELEEQRVYLAQLWLLASATLFLFFVALVFGAAFVVMWCEPTHRLAALGGITGLTIALTVAAAWRWRALLALRPQLLHATLGELQRDRDAVLGRQPS